MSSETVINKNIVWVVTTLVAIGIFIGAFKAQQSAIVSQQKAIGSIEEMIDKNRIAVENIRRNLVSINNIEENIVEIKIDLREIKKIIYKPAIASYETPSNTPKTIKR